MMGTRATLVLAAAAFACAGAARAGVCDYKPSTLAVKTASTIGKSVTDGRAKAGLHAVGYYTLVHSGSGLSLLGTTDAGLTVAGTVSLISGAASAAGTIGAILMAPATMVVGGIAIIGVGAFEGSCYFQVDRITDPDKVREIIESVALEDETVSIVATRDGDAMALEDAGRIQTYLLRKLYIADGQLKHRDFGINTDLGPILFTSAASGE